MVWFHGESEARFAPIHDEIQTGEVQIMKTITVELDYAPKTSVLISGDMVTFRLLEKEDELLLRDFFSRIPERESDTLRDDVRDPSTISDWIKFLDYSRILPLVAVTESTERFAAVATLHFMRGVHRHIADVRIVVGKDFRKLGMGSAMIKELIELGTRESLHYLRAEILTENQLAIKAFRQLGFEAKCTLEGYFLTRKGEARDVLLMLKRLRVDLEEDLFYLF
jgi:L-amino acid N-acyltransferase YncA